jgi:hypothetical protein
VWVCRCRVTGRRCAWLGGLGQARSGVTRCRSCVDRQRGTMHGGWWGGANPPAMSASLLAITASLPDSPSLLPSPTPSLTPPPSLTLPPSLPPTPPPPTPPPAISASLLAITASQAARCPSSAANRAWGTSSANRPPQAPATRALATADASASARTAVRRSWGGWVGGWCQGEGGGEEGVLFGAGAGSPEGLFKRLWSCFCEGGCIAMWREGMTASVTAS